MFKKPKPHGLNGLAEVLRELEDSKASRNKATRSLIVALEKIRERQQEAIGDEQIATLRRFGAI